MVYSRRKVGTEEELHEVALRALTRRAHSIFEMRRALERRSEDASLVRAVLDRLKQRNLLDDVRYARDFARNHALGRRQGRFRIAQELRRRGVPDRHIEAALDEVFATQDEAALVRKRLQQKLRNVRGALDQKRLASLYRSLLRAGFSTDLIRRELIRLDSESLDPAEETAGDQQP
jgi:regulatory protein